MLPLKSLVKNKNQSSAVSLVIVLGKCHSLLYGSRPSATGHGEMQVSKHKRKWIINIRKCTNFKQIEHKLTCVGCAGSEGGGRWDEGLEDMQNLW